MKKIPDPSWEELRRQTRERIESWDDDKKDRVLREIVDALEGRKEPRFR